MITYIYVHNYYVQYDNADATINYALSYLQSDLDSEEASVFFDAAKKRGKAKFEDDYENQFTLTYDYSTYVYTLTKRDY